MFMLHLLLWLLQQAYVPGTDTFIEKDATINEQIEQMRSSNKLNATAQKIIVASVSAIYGLGDPGSYQSMSTAQEWENTSIKAI